MTPIPEAFLDRNRDVRYDYKLKTMSMLEREDMACADGGQYCG
jgi:hypothetical protein